MRNLVNHKLIFSIFFLMAASGVSRSAGTVVVASNDSIAANNDKEFEFVRLQVPLITSWSKGWSIIILKSADYIVCSTSY